MINAIDYLTLERLVCWTSVNGKLLRPHTFGKPALAQKVTSKISAFIRKSYLEKDLRSVTTNVAMYLTLIKTEEYPTLHPQKQALDPLFKDNRIWEISRPPPPFCVDTINGWPLNSSWLWRANIWNNNHIHLFNILSNFLWKNGKS